MQAEDLLARRRDRALAHLLGIKERELDSYLPVDVSNRYRKVVLDVLNDFCELALDILRSVDDESVILNDHFLRMVEEIHERVIDGS